mmetsp:Transcript_22413/g.32756  ORF Transcript_22413/g.32756 Transcript_22413/m.32756 type:complete len:533 (-) Transcript_22413:75-1673(-)
MIGAASLGCFLFILLACAQHQTLVNDTREKTKNSHDDNNLLVSGEARSDGNSKPRLEMLQTVCGEQERMEIIHDTRAKEKHQCKMYFAESSIPNAGFGLFTAVDLERGDLIGEADILVPIIDAFHEDDIWGMMLDVLWGRAYGGGTCNYKSAKRVSVFSPGSGSAINSHMGLSNVLHGSNPIVDDTGLTLSQDPGSGAFSSYYGMSLKAKKAVEAGSELFTSYGAQWFIDRTEWLGYIPLTTDYSRADHIVKKLYEKLDDTTPEVVGALLNFIRHSANERVAAALPKKIDDIEKAYEAGTAKYSLPNFIRTPEWLQENAICADNIRAEKSTIPQAGRGAFATRTILKDSIIAPAPVLHLPRNLMTTYVVIKDKDDEYINSDERIGQQVLLNYCFGHSNSSVLLLPYGPLSNLVNHNRKEANAEIRWSHSRLHRQEWLSFSAEKLAEDDFGLIMDFIALRDIAPGEEIFIDYGTEWEEAWDEHVREWKPPKDAEGKVIEQEYISGEHLRHGFRKEMGVRDGVFPVSWLDISGT